jgi:putative tricarboxylic transport membrane protein
MGMKGWIAKKGADVWTGLFLMVFSGAVINEALKLDVGTPVKPGSGFMIFGAAAVLGVLALLQFLKSLVSQEQRAGQPRERIHLWRIVAVIGVNILYIVLLEQVGYLICTFLLLCFLFQAYERGRWSSAIGGAAATSLLTYVIFSRLLQLNLPKGLISFF